MEKVGGRLGNGEGNRKIGIVGLEDSRKIRMWDGKDCNRLGL